MLEVPAAPTRIIDSRHPSFHVSTFDWEKWRLAYEGGEPFREKYLKQLSSREDSDDFKRRKDMTPIPTFAKAAIRDIRNAIFQRMRDILRTDGSEKYRRAINGLDLGVDRRGSTMNAFLGMKVLEELLVMGRVGVFVDSTVVNGGTLADAVLARPYLYSYAVEDILSWSCTRPEEPSEFQSILLRDTCLHFDERTMLPLTTFQRYRLMWIDKNTGLVNLQFYDQHGKEIDRDGEPTLAPTVLELTRIPFAMIDIGESLMKDVCEYQIAILNLVSADVNFSVSANFPLYTEQRDLGKKGAHLKHVSSADGTSTAGGQGSNDEDIKVGTTQGRAYDKNMDRPDYINPSPDPLKVSIQLQEKLEADIRKLVNLAVISVATRTSAESKSLDNQGLEAGLSYIGLKLESAERLIAEFWSAYEDKVPSRRQIAHIKYPDRYSLKTDSDRIEEATKLAALMFKVPGREVKREIAKSIVQTLLGGKVSVETIDRITAEIQESKYLTSDPATIIQAVQAGLCGEQTGSMALGFQDDEYLQAREDHAERVARIAESQGIGNGNQGGSGDPASRGVPDLSANPSGAGAYEKATSRDTTLRDNTKPPVRGAGKPKIGA
jgi:hypothetical protein